MSVGSGHRTTPLRRGDPERLGVYQLLGRLGSGGMGVVYLGRDDHDQLAAVKLVHANLAGDDEFRRRFRSEVSRARQVPPFCTAEVLDADLDHEPPYLVVEYIDGPSLAEVVEERGPLTPANLHSVAIGVATALTAIHGAGVIHRDLKPRNVLLAPGSPKVIDFGIARALEPTSQHTRTDQMVGTVAYMAPERFDSEPGTPLTPAADIFAWGVVVAYAGTGRTPFNGDSPPATAARILTQPPHLDGLTGTLRDLVGLALAKVPADRPTARELLDMLLATGPQQAPQLAEVLERQPALQTAATGVRDLSGTGDRGDRPVADRLAGVPRQRSRFDEAGQTAHRYAGRPGHLGELPLAAGPPTGPPPDPLHDLVPGRPAHARRSSRWRTVAVAAAALVLLGGTAVAALAVVANIDPGEYAATANQPVVTDPGVPVIQDRLNEAGQWLDSEIREERSNCVIDGVMRATRVSRGVYQCAGPEDRLPLDSSVDVLTTLESAGSCSAIWLRWNGTGGYQVRLCADEVQIAVDKTDDKRVLETLPLAAPIRLDRPTAVRVAVRDGVAEVFLDGQSVGSATLTEADLVEGQVLLGISVSTITQRPPYTVSFADVDIRSLQG
jgi:predicted Ser/Thr protein kinase